MLSVSQAIPVAPRVRLFFAETHHITTQVHGLPQSYVSFRLQIHDECVSRLRILHEEFRPKGESPSGNENDRGARGSETALITFRSCARRPHDGWRRTGGRDISLKKTAGFRAVAAIVSGEALLLSERLALSASNSELREIHETCGSLHHTEKLRGSEQRRTFGAKPIPNPWSILRARPEDRPHRKQKQSRKGRSATLAAPPYISMAYLQEGDNFRTKGCRKPPKRAIIAGRDNSHLKRPPKTTLSKSVTRCFSKP